MIEPQGRRPDAGSPDVRLCETIYSLRATRYLKPVCLIPTGYPERPFGPLERRPVSGVTYYDGWGRTA